MIFLGRFLTNRVIRPAVEKCLYGRAIRPLEAILRERETWEPAYLRQWQVSQLRPFLQHCYDNVPFYRRRFDEVGFRPSKFEDLSQLAAIPPLTKADIRAHADDLFARGFGPRGLRVGRTGGSTGEPTLFYQSNEETAWAHATVRRFWGMAGIVQGDRRVCLGGRNYTPTWRTRVYPNYFKMVENYYTFPSAFLSTAILDDYIRQIQRLRPRALGGYPSSVSLLAARLIETAQRIPSVEVVWGSSEVMTDLHRARIRQGFGVEPFDAYGGGDTPVATECQVHQGLHLFQSSRLIEVADEQGNTVGPGGSGRVLVTTFYNWAWPYVRYDMGDVVERGTFGDCPCGCRLERIAQVQGRTGDYLVTPDGRFATPPNLTLVFVSIADKVRAFQAVQHDRSEMEMRVVVTPEWSKETEAYVIRSLRSFLGDEIRIHVRLVDDVEITPVGKRRVMVSTVPDGLFVPTSTPAPK